MQYPFLQYSSIIFSYIYVYTLFLIGQKTLLQVCKKVVGAEQGKMEMLALNLHWQGKSQATIGAQNPGQCNICSDLQFECYGLLWAWRNYSHRSLSPFLTGTYMRLQKLQSRRRCPAVRRWILGKYLNQLKTQCINESIFLSIKMAIIWRFMCF